MERLLIGNPSSLRRVPGPCLSPPTPIVRKGFFSKARFSKTERENSFPQSILSSRDGGAAESDL